jgi:hypothetical protein
MACLRVHGRLIRFQPKDVETHLYYLYPKQLRFTILVLVSRAPALLPCNVPNRIPWPRSQDDNHDGVTVVITVAVLMRQPISAVA